MTEQTDTKPRVQIGIILCSNIPKQAVPALKFLILQLNALQSTFEYQCVPCTGDPLLVHLSSKTLLNRCEIEKDLARFCRDYESELKQEITSYGLGSTPPDKYIIISRARFRDRYYMTGTEGVGILALGYWERIMAPPSLVESILGLVLKFSLCELRDIPFASHFGTKGCVFDFNADLSNARFVALQGFVCSDCRRKLHVAGHSKLADEVTLILAKKWLGKTTNPNSVAGIAAKLGYDLFATKGLTPRWSERLMSALKEDGVKELIRIVGEVLIVVLLVLLGLKELSKRTQQSPQPMKTMDALPAASPGGHR